MNGCDCNHTFATPCPHGCHDWDAKTSDDPMLEILFELAEMCANQDGELDPFYARPARGTGFDGLDEAVDDFLVRQKAERWLTAHLTQEGEDDD